MIYSYSWDIIQGLPSSTETLHTYQRKTMDPFGPNAAESHVYESLQVSAAGESGILIRRRFSLLEWIDTCGVRSSNSEGILKKDRHQLIFCVTHNNGNDMIIRLLQIRSFSCNSAD